MGISLNDRSIEPSEVYVLKPFNVQERIWTLSSSAQLTLSKRS